MLSNSLIDSLFPAGLPGPDEWERRYPPRELPPGAEVTRFSPSPTGYLHIGGVYVAIIDADIAQHSGGTYLLRIEDTDQARVTEGAVDQFADALTYFSISPQEDDLNGRYGPYVQSSRQEIYLTYVRELLRRGKAYLCFATKAELEDISARQRAAGALPGYYGPWAIWRDAPEEQVRERLAAGEVDVVAVGLVGGGIADVGVQRVAVIGDLRRPVRTSDRPEPAGYAGAGDWAPGQRWPVDGAGPVTGGPGGRVRREPVQGVALGVGEDRHTVDPGGFQQRPRGSGARWHRSRRRQRDPQQHCGQHREREGSPPSGREGRPQRAIKPWATARPPNGRERCKGAEDEGGQRGEVDNLDHPGCYPGGGADLSEPEQSDPQRQEVAAESCQRERGPRRRQQTAARCEEAQTKGKCRDQLK